MSYVDFRMQEWGISNLQPEWAQASIRTVLEELHPEALLCLKDARLEVRIVPTEGYCVWTYFTVQGNRHIARELQPRPETRILLVFGTEGIERDGPARFEDHLRDHLGHTLLYLRASKARNECADAMKEWRACKDTGSVRKPNFTARERKARAEAEAKARKIRAGLATAIARINRNAALERETRLSASTAAVTRSHVRLSNGRKKPAKRDLMMPNQEPAGKRMTKQDRATLIESLRQDLANWDCLCQDCVQIRARGLSLLTGEEVWPLQQTGEEGDEIVEACLNDFDKEIDFDEFLSGKTSGRSGIFILYRSHRQADAPILYLVSNRLASFLKARMTLQ